MGNQEDTPTVIQQWLNRIYWDSGRLAVDSQIRPYFRYAIADHFLNTAALSEVHRMYQERSFTRDNVGLNYDSASSVITEGDALYALLNSSHWIRWLHAALGDKIPDTYSTVFGLRRHAAYAHGFWPHSDDLEDDPKRIAFLLYLGKRWTAQDGGLLQLWQPQKLSSDTPALYSWEKWVNRRLTFLENSSELEIELGGPRARPPVRLRLLDQIVPLENRAVILLLRPDLAIHSVTPNRERERRSVLQWII